MGFKTGRRTGSCLRSKKGAALAEAALVYPAAIMTMFLALALSVLLYRECCFSAIMHMSLREAGGRATETILEGKRDSSGDMGTEKECEDLVRQRLAKYWGDSAGTIDVTRNRLAVIPKLKAEGNRKGNKLPLLQNTMGIHIEGELSLQNEAAFLRNKRLVTEGGS